MNSESHSQPASHLATPSTNRKGGSANVLVAKPLKMISSKIAEHYKREPRLAVSMSEVMSFNAEDSEEDEIEQDNELVDTHGHPHDDNDLVEDRIQRAKRELEEMSIGNSFESFENNDETEETSTNHIEEEGAYVKSSLHQSTTIEMMPIDDDVLMDRLVEEMLVNDNEDNGAGVNGGIRDQEHAANENALESVDQASPVPVPISTAPVKSTQSKKKQTKSTGLTRRPMTYFSGTETTEEGLRRSCRMKMEPLRYWANEKVCYGRAEDPSITLPVIVNVIKKPELDDPTFMMGLTRKRRRPDGNVSKLKAQAFGPDCDVESEVYCYERPGEEEVRLLALSHHHVQGDEVKDSSFKIHTIFTEGTYMSSGQLIFPPLSHKPTKNSSRHALVFYVISGSFRIEINRISFMIGPGGQFHVPRANPYTITHVSEDKNVEGRLFFCHCKDNSE